MAQTVWATAMKSNGDTAGQFHDEIIKGLKQCGEPDDVNVEQRAVAAGQSALYGLAMLHRMVAQEVADQADCIPAVPGYSKYPIILRNRHRGHEYAL